MKLIDTLLLYPSLALFIIGLHQVVRVGFAGSYWILMLAMMLLFGYQWRKARRQASAGTPPSSPKNPPTGKRKKTS